MERKVAWNEYDEEGRNNVFDFAKNILNSYLTVKLKESA